MADREKVIYSIERCICHVPDACRDCGYDNREYNECVEKLLRDALELLKEQEQRLITLEEVKNHNNKDNCVWFELRDIVVIPVFIKQDRQETIIENPCILSDQTIPHLYWKNIDYCKKWRCWTSKPTEEQRKAVMWDDR